MNRTIHNIFVCTVGSQLSGHLGIEGVRISEMSI